MTHDTTPLVNPRGNTVEIDVDIVPLIKALWSKGINTFYCCQGNHNDDMSSKGEDDQGYVMFKRDRNSTEFLQFLMAEYPPFKNMTPTLLRIEFDYHPQFGGSRATIRFSYKDRRELTKLVVAYNPSATQH